MYQTGLYADYTDLIDKIRLFLISTGFTIDDYSDSSVDYSGVEPYIGKRLHFHKESDQYFNMQSAFNQQIYAQNDNKARGIGLCGSRAYSGTDPWDNQSGGLTFKGGAAQYILETSGTYYFFSDTNQDVITIMIQSAYADNYQKMCFGKLPNGWQFFDTGQVSTDITYVFSGLVGVGGDDSYHSSVYVPGSGWVVGADNGAPTAPALVHSLYYLATSDHKCRFARYGVQYSPSDITGNPVLSPCVYSYFDGTNYQIIGAIPDIFYVSMRGLADKEEIVLGSTGETYVVFENHPEDSTLGLGKGSGVAIRKVV